MSARTNGHAKTLSKIKRKQLVAAMRALGQENLNALADQPLKVVENRMRELLTDPEGCSSAEIEKNGSTEAFDPQKEDQNGFSAPSPEFPDSHDQPAAASKDEREERNRGGRPPVLDDYARGKVVVALAVGLTQAEAAAWVRCDPSTVSNLLRRDERVAKDLEWYKGICQLHPFLKVYNEVSTNWKASVWLLEYLEKRHGQLKTEHLMGMFLRVWGQMRGDHSPRELTQMRNYRPPKEPE